MEKVLMPEVAAKYELVGVEPGHHNFAGLGDINLCEMDLAFADQLFAAKVPFLRLKKKALKAKESPNE